MKKLLTTAIFIGMATWVQAQDRSKQIPPVAGADKDAHGCKASAGYTYSQIRKDCIRVFEEKIQLKATQQQGAYTSNAIIVFSDDRKKAEVFMAPVRTSVVLNRSGNEGSYVWKKGNLALSQEQGYVLKKNDKVLFSER